jgi:hypothetical protein
MPADILSLFPALLGYASHLTFLQLSCDRRDVSRKVDVDGVRGGEGWYTLWDDTVLVQNCE